MKIIDAHHHTWDRTIFPYSWMDDPHPVGDISDVMMSINNLHKKQLS